MIKEIFERNRSYRRYYEDKRIDAAELRDIISINRYLASGANAQRLRFLPVYDRSECERVFSCLKWAAFLKDWDGPAEGERPAAYIIIATKDDVTADVGVDVGISAQAMLSLAVEKGMGGCMLLSFDRERLSSILSLDGYKIRLVIALGYPKEKVVITDAVNGDTKYYRDENSVHYVPKLSTDEIIIGRRDV